MGSRPAAECRDAETTGAAEKSQGEALDAAMDDEGLVVVVLPCNFREADELLLC